ncbi:hypothetical protein TBLA_0A07480 [Henningerozyma blattae CBS 6284]|uniref:Zn(2)-C6 fungal-type domain-containing protein n=1 Tax=Henningerozyma blattae (strain ATCC 34711 / CBS 6284 / DSM 70876 / NBRC 10599 / NRRL Y-10934 / UCD 77-7) TaxID=1071380 RepID=I2GWN6_HENB6|nr:hypothetical protein TBLA_0A07480 [Tetrapisispora blattae CBS 6284]CCH58538.1 hypothetical protein TBLA_0A07480 [Tetrapisispora blattae CBS 6284]
MDSITNNRRSVEFNAPTNDAQDQKFEQKQKLVDKTACTDEMKKLHAEESNKKENNLKHTATTSLKEDLPQLDAITDGTIESSKRSKELTKKSSDSIKRPRKKRKTFSCEICRKFKTRCDFEPLVGKCHRCNILQLNCSLTVDRKNEIAIAMENSYNTSSTFHVDKPMINKIVLKDNSISKTKYVPKSIEHISKAATTATNLADETAVAIEASKVGTPLTSKASQLPQDTKVLPVRESHSISNETASASDTSLSKINLASSPHNTNIPSIEKRLNHLEKSFSKLHTKLDVIISILQGSGTNSITGFGPSSTINTGNSALENSNARNAFNVVPYNYRRFSATNSTLIQEQNAGNEFSVGFVSKTPICDGIKLKEPPLKLIRDINERLFPTRAISKKDKIALQQRPFVVARINFLNFFNKNRQLCKILTKEFLVRSQFWIIPTIKEITDEYANNHLFITSVFTIIAMSFDDEEKYGQEQEELYPLVERLLTNTLTMFEKLTDVDIEAILYCSMFHISRKAKRHRQLRFNSLVLTNFAIQSLLNVVDFHKIRERVIIHEEYNNKDLYHLRILNALTACNLEYSISYGTVSSQDVMVKEFNNLTIRFPQSTHSDNIKVSEINLSETVNSIFLDFKSYFKNFKMSYYRSINESNDQSPKDEAITFIELEYWLQNWDDLLSKKGTGILLYMYDFYYVMICRSFISEFLPELQEISNLLKYTIYTMKSHSFSLLNGFLRLAPHIIKGSPIFTTHQLVYACLTLCDFLHWFDLSERQHVLNMCTRVYWHLNTIGEKKNEATDNVGTIIKSIIDTSKRRVSLINFPVPPLPPSVQGQYSSSKSNTAVISSSAIAVYNKDKNGSESPDSVHSHASTAEVNAGNIVFPDVDQFNSFEDFFQDFFDHLKPTAQRIFSGAQPRNPHHSISRSK